MRVLRSASLRRLLLLSVLLPASASAGEIITDIRFAGNDVTQAEILLQEMTIRVGDPVDAARVEESRQAIQDLGLFKKVEAALIPAEGGKILQITVKEKFYLLPLPRANRNADGDISYGAQLRYDNLLGLNQRLKLTYEIREPIDGARIAAYSIAYDYPRVARTPYSLGVNIEYVPGYQLTTTDAGGAESRFEYDNANLSIGVSRQLAREGPTRGWSAGVGYGFSFTDYRRISGTASPPAEGRDGYVTAGMNYADVRDYLYSRAGETYGYNIQYASPALGSHHHETWRHYWYYRKYKLVSPYPHRNLNYQLQFGLSDGHQGDAFSLGGADSLRGYPRGVVSGKAYFLANVEYLQPLFRNNALRGLVFLDIGNGYPGNFDIDPTDVEASVGIGLRYRVEALVKFDLRLDLAYAIGRKETKPYAGSSDTF